MWLRACSSHGSAGDRTLLTSRPSALASDTVPLPRRPAQSAVGPVGRTHATGELRAESGELGSHDGVSLICHHSGLGTVLCGPVGHGQWALRTAGALSRTPASWRAQLVRLGSTRHGTARLVLRRRRGGTGLNVQTGVGSLLSEDLLKSAPQSMI